MKQLFLLSIISILLASCNNSGKPTVTGKDSAASQPLPDEVEQRLEQMKNLTPLSADKIKAMFPEEVEGMKLSDYRAINNEGYESGEASYKSDDGKELLITIFDCVGEAGVGKYNLMYLGSLSAESKDDNSYTKTIQFNGDKAVESYEKDDDKYSLLFPSANRLLVMIEGERTGPDIAKKAAKDLNLRPN